MIAIPRPQCAQAPAVKPRHLPLSDQDLERLALLNCLEEFLGIIARRLFLKGVPSGIASEALEKGRVVATDAIVSGWAQEMNSRIRRSWLWVVVRNAVAEILRRPVPAPLPEDDILPARLDTGNRIDLRDALGLLHPDEREVIEALYFYGYNYTEAARHLGMPRSTLRRRHDEAIERLRKILTSQ